MRGPEFYWARRHGQAAWTVLRSTGTTTGADSRRLVEEIGAGGHVSLGRFDEFAQIVEFGFGPPAVVTTDSDGDSPIVVEVKDSPTRNP